LERSWRSPPDGSADGVGDAELDEAAALNLAMRSDSLQRQRTRPDRVTDPDETLRGCCPCWSAIVAGASDVTDGAHKPPERPTRAAVT